jgi:hypothetical protein
MASGIHEAMAAPVDGFKYMNQTDIHLHTQEQIAATMPAHMRPTQAEH